MIAEERRQVLKDALVAAAEAVIAERGLPALRARDLAGTVGCAVGAIYTAFADLDALVLEVNVRTLAVFEAAISRTPTIEPLDGPVTASAELVRLARAYLAFAGEHPRRWRALFQHRMAGERAPPAWYVDEQARLFRLIERPLGVLRPDLAADRRALLARTLFSATHGVVSLGLDEKLAALPGPVVDEQLVTVVRAMAIGLSAEDDDICPRLT